MKKEVIVGIVGLIGVLGTFSGATYDTTAIIASIVVIFLLSGYLYTILQKSEASTRTPSNPITSLDQNAMAVAAFFAVLILYLMFFYIGTFFRF